MGDRKGSRWGPIYMMGTPALSASASGYLIVSILLCCASERDVKIGITPHFLGVVVSWPHSATRYTGSSSVGHPGVRQYRSTVGDRKKRRITGVSAGGI